VFHSKFESQYLYDLLGGTPDQIPDVYKDRSPVNHASSIKSPLLVLQGEDDRVVPIEQADAIVEAVKTNGTLVEYIVFKGEGHGFRQTPNQIKSYTSQLRFFRAAFGLEGGEE
jgi:dipeptidyl aminopeptidase/acylaminoacyl peptidase